MALPTATFVNRNTPYFFPYTETPTFSTIVAQNIFVDTPAGAVWGVSEGASPGSLIQVATVSTTSTNLITLTDGVKDLFVGLPSGGNSNATLTYSHEGTVKGDITFVSSINNTYSGGVAIAGEDGTTLTVGAQASATVGPLGGQIQHYIPNPSNGFVQFYSGGAPPYSIASQVFMDAQSNAISLISGAAGSGNPYMTVDTNGVVIYPGASNSVFFANGYLNMNSNALSNVSSINGVAYPPPAASFVPVTWGSNFSIGNQGYVTSNAFPTLIASAVVETGATYRISMNPTFNNTSAPAAGDYLSIYGTSAAGPQDTIDFITFNLNWTATGMTPGLTNNYGQAVSGVMTALDSNYYFEGLFNPGCSVSTLVAFGQTNGIVIEKLF